MIWDWGWHKMEGKMAKKMRRGLDAWTRRDLGVG